MPNLGENQFNSNASGSTIKSMTLMWTKGINTMPEGQSQRLLERIFNTAPPQPNISTSSVLTNVSTMEGDGTVGEIPEFQYQMQGKPSEQHA